MTRTKSISRSKPTPIDRELGKRRIPNRAIFPSRISATPIESWRRCVIVLSLNFQRGPIDAAADNYFDSVSLSVEVKKNGRNDGVYVFGSRIMKIQSDSGSLVGKFFRCIDSSVVNAPKTRVTVDDFIAKFERTEALRLKGLRAGTFFCAFE